MEKLLTNSQIYDLATQFGLEYKSVKAIIQVESGQHGFSEKTGRIIIQFEPSWFKRENTDWKQDTKHTVWQSNQVGDQTAEWIAFNDAFASDADAAMKSTSIGMMQVMGFHYAEVGFKTVGAMWEYGKVSESNQVEIALKWIKTVPALYEALKAKDWAKVAYYYNGSGYAKFHYDDRLIAAYRLVEDFTPVKKAA
jgi:hypothetical protein